MAVGAIDGPARMSPEFSGAIRDESAFLYFWKRTLPDNRELVFDGNVEPSLFTPGISTSSVAVGASITLARGK
jgi:hypothetical protein